ncbi:unnamed protein product [Cylindrotheca closterium]|uniref:Uncharacterized protein n=1 Tax=Cylindrotheca closterium TaxID=2856 RepID=A0AAD2FZC8_9STRA|nr:unnamed protein product [Cylindrotheca closterium]
MTTESAPKCVIDDVILNPETLKDMENIALSFFASACGRNRGAFVLHPPDGQTYSCLQLPENIVDLSGAESVDDSVKITTSNDIQNQYIGGNITASDTLSMLNFLIDSVYQSTPEVEATPFACEFNGLAKLECGKENMKSSVLLASGEPIRSATLAGLFVPAPWATGGKTLTLKQAEKFYTEKDFMDMKSAGLNTVQIAVPTAAFDPKDELGQPIMSLLETILKNVSDAGLVAILNIVSTGDELDKVVAAATFCDQTEGVLAMTIPSETMLDPKSVVDSIRVLAPDFPIFLPVSQADLTNLPAWTLNDKNLFGALETSHMGTVADIASSTSKEDRSKMFYHEATTCMARSTMEFASCFGNLPLFLSSGFDLSIDDCVNYSLPGFADYGQCDRFDETTDSPFWERHRMSFAARQVFAYEQGMGWSFAAWKLYDNDEVGTLDKVEKLMALQDVMGAGLFPELDGPTVATEACLNPPKVDFILGDDTLAPSMGPPPDCGNGWWNYETSQCDYWIPPTPAPTEGCPECVATTPANATGAALIGALLGGAVVGGIVWKLLGNKRNDYDTIPN